MSYVSVLHYDHYNITAIRTSFFKY